MGDCAARLDGLWRLLGFSRCREACRAVYTSMEVAHTDQETLGCVGYSKCRTGQAVWCHSFFHFIAQSAYVQARSVPCDRTDDQRPLCLLKLLYIFSGKQRCSYGNSSGRAIYLRLDVACDAPFSLVASMFYDHAMHCHNRSLLRIWSAERWWG